MVAITNPTPSSLDVFNSVTGVLSLLLGIWLAWSASRSKPQPTTTKFPQATTETNSAVVRESAAEARPTKPSRLRVVLAFYPRKLAAFGSSILNTISHLARLVTNWWMRDEDQLRPGPVAFIGRIMAAFIGSAIGFIVSLALYATFLEEYRETQISISGWLELTSFLLFNFGFPAIIISICVAMVNPYIGALKRGAFISFCFFVIYFILIDVWLFYIT